MHCVCDRYRFAAAPGVCPELHRFTGKMLAALRRLRARYECRPQATPADGEMLQWVNAIKRAAPGAKAGMSNVVPCDWDHGLAVGPFHRPGPGSCTSPWCPKLHTRKRKASDAATM